MLLFFGDQVVLVRRESLRRSTTGTIESTKAMSGMITAWWKEKSFSKILSEDDFKNYLFHELKDVDYAKTPCGLRWWSLSSESTE